MPRKIFLLLFFIPLALSAQRRITLGGKTLERVPPPVPTNVMFRLEGKKLVVYQSGIRLKDAQVTEASFDVKVNDIWVRLMLGRENNVNAEIENFIRSLASGQEIHFEGKIQIPGAAAKITPPDLVYRVN
jgi:hypothetical protein